MKHLCRNVYRDITRESKENDFATFWDDCVVDSIVEADIKCKISSQWAEVNFLLFCLSEFLPRIHKMGDSIINIKKKYKQTSFAL